jgi:hypothetical protein
MSNSYKYLLNFLIFKMNNNKKKPLWLYIQGLMDDF